MKKIFYYNMLIAFFICVAVNLFAQKNENSESTEDMLSMSLDELMNMNVTSASKKAENINKAPGLITVISHQEIEAYSAKNLGDVLNKVVGTLFLNPIPYLSNAMVIRAQDNSQYDNHVLILMDGRPVRDPISGGLNMAFYTTFPLDLIERIEIIRGPGSVLYGSCAFSGVINVITKQETENGYKAIVAIDDIDPDADFLFSQKATVIYRNNDFKMNASFINLYNKGERFDFKDFSGKDSSHYFDARNLGAIANFDYKNLKLSLLYFDYKPFSLEENAASWVGSGYGQNDHKTIFADLGYDFEITNNYHLQTNLTYNKHEWHKSDTTQINVSDGLFEAALFGNPAENINFIVGGTYSKDFFDSRLLLDNEKSTFSIYGQVDYTPIEWLKLIGGFQYNKIEGIDGSLSPRIGVIANYNENLGVKVLYSSAFRKGYPTETAISLLYTHGALQLEPEKINTFETQIFYTEKSWSANISFYQSHMYDVIGSILHTGSDGTYLTYVNQSSSDYWGIEYEMKVSIIQNLVLTGNAAYQTNKTNDTLDNYALHPNYIAKIGAMYNYEFVNLGVFNGYYDSPHDVPNPLVNVNKGPSAFNLLSVKISIDVFKMLGKENKSNLELSLEALNVLDMDVRYPDFAAYLANTYMPLTSGMQLYGSMKFTF